MVKIKSHFKILAVLFLISLTDTAMFSQIKTHPVDLETVMKLTGADNLTIKEYSLRYQQSLADETKADEWWLPSIYFGATSHYLNGAAMNTDGTILHPVERNNLWAGLGLFVEWDLSKGIYNTLAAEQRSESFEYKSQAQRNQQVLKAIEAYFDLQVEQMKFSAVQRVVILADSLAQQIKMQVDSGLRYQSEYLLAQSNYSHLKITLLQTKADWQKKSAELRNILNLEDNVLLVSSDSALFPINLNEINTDTLHQSNFYQKRPEYSDLQSGLSSLQTERQSVAAGVFMPSLQIGTDDALFGKIQSPYYNTYRLNAALVWQIPLGRFTYNGDLKQYDAKILIQQNELEKFKNQALQELTQNFAQLQAAEEQMKLAEEALKLSVEALNQSIERQKLGTAKPFEVFLAQQFYLQAQVDYLKAVSDYNKAQYTIKVVMGENL